MNDKSTKALELYNKFLVSQDCGDLEGVGNYLRKSARLGELMAYHVLAYCEFDKKEPRVEWALRYYRRAAKKGFSPSAWNLARFYENKGKEGLYRKWMRRAADLGDPDASSELKSRGC